MQQPPFNNLSDWLSWQETLHPEEIELGLDRIQEVAERLGLLQTSAVVLTVGGTNGKGSSVQMLSNCYVSAGYTVGRYTSPHLFRYNDRVCINEQSASDEQLCSAFTAIEAARQGISLTYFEYGTLAALWLFSQADIDVIILEVGLGGRLDAVNVLDADVALVTNVGLDHLDWLGVDRDSIGAEKAGILRPAQLAVYNDPDPARGLLEKAEKIGCELKVLGEDYSFTLKADTWSWHGESTELIDLPRRGMPGHQLLNASGVLMVLCLASKRLPIDIREVSEHLLRHLPDGRGQWLEYTDADADKQIRVLVDVAHNSEAVNCLAEVLENTGCDGKTYAIFAAMADKPVENIGEIMREKIDQWLVFNLNVPRACTAEVLQDRLNAVNINAVKLNSLDDAWQVLLSTFLPEDRVVVFGSFLTVEAMLKKIKGTIE